MCRIIFNFFRFDYAEMRKKLWPNAFTKEGALGQTSKNLKIYFIHIIFFKKPNKKFTIELKSYTAMLLYLFFDSLLSTCLKKMETEKWPNAADSPLHFQFFSYAFRSLNRFTTFYVTLNRLVRKYWNYPILPFHFFFHVFSSFNPFLLSPFLLAVSNIFK